MAAISTDLDQPLCVYLNRRGQVIRVGVGTPRQTRIPPLELPRYGAERLCGIRCIATQLKQDPPSTSDLTAMAMQRLDSLIMVTLSGQGFERRGGGATGYVRELYLAHLVPHPEARWTVSDPMTLEAVAQQDFVALTEALEAEFRRVFIAQQVDADHDRVIVVGLLTGQVSKTQFQYGLMEVERLVETAGGEVLATLHQRRDRPHPQTVLGAGKVQEIALEAQTLGGDAGGV